MAVEIKKKNSNSAIESNDVRRYTDQGPKPQTLMKSLTDLCFASFADRGVYLG